MVVSIVMGGYIMMVVVGVVVLVWCMKMVEMVVCCLVSIGVLFIFICLVIGFIWGKFIWGIWWVWDVRLIFMLVLFFFYIGVMVLNLVINNV